MHFQRVLFILSCSLLVFIYSCDDNKISRPELSKLELNEVGKVFLPLDSQTTAINEFYQVLETDSMILFTFFNALNYNLYFYNFNEKTFLKKIPFKKEGPNGIGTYITSYQIVSNEQVIFHTYYERKLSFCNMTGEVIKSFRLHNERNNFYALTNQYASFFIEDNLVTMPSGISCNRIDGVHPLNMMQFDLEDSSINAFLDFPSSYDKSDNKFWPESLCDIYLSRGKDANILVSFPLSDSVISINDDKVTSKHYFGAPNFESDKAIRRSRATGDPMEEIKLTLGYKRYSIIHYDPYKKIHLRSFLDQTDQELLDQNILRLNQSLLVADENLNPIGEMTFQGSDNLFFTKDGMYQIIYSVDIEDSLEVRHYEYGF